MILLNFLNSCFIAFLFFLAVLPFFGIYLLSIDLLKGLWKNLMIFMLDESIDHSSSEEESS